MRESSRGKGAPAVTPLPDSIGYIRRKGTALSNPKIDLERLRAVARLVLSNRAQLREAGLAARAEDTVVAHALALALGIDGRYVTDNRALFHAADLRAALATITGPVAEKLIVSLDDALQAQL